MESIDCNSNLPLLSRFQMDAFRATQLAAEYGLLREGARERLEEMLINEEGDLVDHEDDIQSPVALPLVGELP